MEALLDFVQENPLYLAGTAVLLLFFIAALVKKAAKLALLALVLNAGYGYYLNDLAQDYYRQAQQKLEAAQRQVESVRGTVESAGESVDKAGDLFEQAGELIER